MTRTLTAPVESNEIYDQTMADLAFAMRRQIRFGAWTTSEDAPDWMDQLWCDVTEPERQSDSWRPKTAYAALEAISHNGPHARLEASGDASELTFWLSLSPNRRVALCDEVRKDGEDIGRGLMLDILMAAQQREINDIVETLTEAICERIDHSTVTWVSKGPSA